MNLDLQYRINQDPNLKRFLRENSFWYKYLNRSNIYYKDFVNNMKDEYKLKPTDRLNKMAEDINTIKTLLDLIK